MAFLLERHRKWRLEKHAEAGRYLSLPEKALVEQVPRGDYRCNIPDRVIPDKKRLVG